MKVQPREYWYQATAGLETAELAGLVFVSLKGPKKLS